MKKRNLSKLTGLLAAAITALASPSAHAGISGPYTADANTLHLWHLDEADPGPALPAPGVSGSFNLTAESSATLGNPAFSGFGTAGNTAALAASGFKGNSILASSLAGTNGEFTLEAMVNVSSITTGNQQIIAMETSAAVRPFQFRINASGALEFINIGGGGSPGSAAIPLVGDNAFVPNEWFHVAVTYNGDAGVADNFKYYWTRVDANQTEANEISSLSMGADLTGTAVLGVGNEYRGTSSEHLLGSIDEVRISSVVRGAGDFIFFDMDPPLLTTTDPADNATDVLITSNLVANFNERVVAGSGIITLMQTGEVSPVESFDVSVISPRLVVGGTTLEINPTNDLIGGIEYYVLIPSGAIQDLAGNDYAGLSDPADWSFTADGTPPAVASLFPANGEPAASPRPNLTVTFDENVQLGSGDITIHLANSNVVQTIDVNSAAVTINGAVVSIASSQLAELTDYYINISAGAFTDLSGNAFAGITNDSIWTFKTAAFPVGVIYANSFTSTSTDDLNGTEPETTTDGETWVASDLFDQNGFVTEGVGSTTLAFTPYDGFVYTLDASLTNVAGNSNWFALGFVNGQSTQSTLFDRFITGDVVGTAWMLYRGDASANANQAHLGEGTRSAGNTGLTSSAAWTALTNENPGGDIDMRIVLNTASGPGGWTATWFAKRPADGSYALVRGTESMLSETFDAVGIAISGSGVTGTISDFSLTAAVGGSDTYADWIAGFNVGGLTALNDDADLDGVENGVENFFGTDPSVFSAGLTATAAGSGSFTFTHPQANVSASDLTAAYRWSKDLQTFSGDNGTLGGTTVDFVIEANTPSAGMTTVTANVTGTATDRIFVRVAVTQD